MLTNYKKGIIAEQKAALYLQNKGHVILEKRFKTPYGEIDLISKDGPVFVFTEVKQRPTHAQAAHALTATQKKRLQNASLVYTQTIQGTKPCRFDVVLLDRHQNSTHIQNVIWDE